MLPNFLIVGAMKAGTSAFAYCLEEHHDIYIPEKELHFFNSEGNYRRGLNFYETMFVGCRQEKAVGEKTPSYSHHPSAPERIAKDLPEVKLLWVLRNPVDRAFSHYWYFVGKGKERLTFEAALERERSGRAPHFTMNYLNRGCYARQIERYLEFFERSDMMIILYEEFQSSAQAALSETCRFLDVDPDYRFNRVGEQRNVTYLPRSRWLQWATYHALPGRGARARRLVRRVNRRARPGYPSLDRKVEQQLADFYAPHNEELARLTGLDLSTWGN